MGAMVASAQPAARGTIVVYPTVFDKSGTDTSRKAAEAALKEVLKKGGFKLVASETAAAKWRSNGLRVPTSERPPSSQDLAKVGRLVSADFAVTTHVSFHTRSIWVNLGPKTISDCHMVTTIVDSKSGKVVYEGDATGRSDEKSDTLRVLGALLISPLTTAISGGPKTPQETRAAQIAAARSLEQFVKVKADAPYVGTWQWIRFDGMDDRVIQVDDPAKYVLTFSADGTVSGRADTNRFNGKYSVKDAALRFSGIASTKVAVPAGSLHDKFLQGLNDTASYVMRDGMLYLALKVDAGIMVFKRV
jgi:heat shock protein HslJ